MVVALSDAPELVVGRACDMGEGMVERHALSRSDKAGRGSQK